MSSYRALSLQLTQSTYLGDNSLAVEVSSFPPFGFELFERAYPNKRIAASRSLDTIRAAARLYHGARP